MRGRLRTLVGATFGFAVAGCCGDDVRLVSFSFDPGLGMSTSYAWVGDTMTMYAGGFASGTTFFCTTHEEYNSFQSPQRFQFTSTDAAVATLSELGLFTARAAGVTRLAATTAGIKNELWVVVSPSFAKLQITITPTTVRVGDTVTVQVNALDSTGAVVTGVQATGPGLVESSDKLATWISRSPRSQAQYPNIAFPTPFLDRLVMRGAGRVALEVAVPHDATRPRLHYFADTLFISVQPQ